LFGLPVWRIAFVIIGGAILGAPIGWWLSEEVSIAVFAACAGAFIGGAVAGKRVRVVGFAVLVGAAFGGVFAAVAGSGRVALEVSLIGGLLGLAVGLMLEYRLARE
jgi:hypothetical protein